MRSCSCKEWIEEVEGGCHCVLDWSLNLGVEVFIEVVLESDASKQRGLCCLNFFWKPISLCKFHSSLPRLKCSLFLSLRSVYFLSLLDMGLYLPRFGFKLHHWDWHALIEFDGVIGCWSLRRCCYVCCSGSLAWSLWRIFWVEFYFCVCVGCYVWLPRNSKKIWEFFF